MECEHLSARRRSFAVMQHGTVVYQAIDRDKGKKGKKGKGGKKGGKKKGGKKGKKMKDLTPDRYGFNGKTCFLKVEFYSCNFHFIDDVKFVYRGIGSES